MPESKKFRAWIEHALPSLPPEQRLQVLHQVVVSNGERLDELEAWRASVDALRKRALFWLLAFAILAANLGPEKAIEIVAKTVTKVYGG